MHDPSLHKYKCDTIWNACYSVPKPQQLYTSSQQLRAYVNTILHVPDMCICCHQCSIGKAMNQPNSSSRGCQYIHIVGIHFNINEGWYSNKHKKSSGQELSHASANKVQIKCLLTIPWGLFVGKCIGLALEEGGGLSSVGQHFYNPALGGDDSLFVCSKEWQQINMHHHVHRSRWRACHWLFSVCNSSLIDWDTSRVLWIKRAATYYIVWWLLKVSASHKQLKNVVGSVSNICWREKPEKLFCWPYYIQNRAKL